MKRLLINFFCCLFLTGYLGRPTLVFGEAPVATESGMQKFSKFFDGPPGILLISAIATVYSGILYKDADKQEKKSKENVKKIAEILTAFNNSFTTFCPNGRDDIKYPACYCYNEDKKKNANRTNSQICQALWKKGDYKLAANADNYNSLPYNPDVAGCVAINGQFDENCKCRKFVDDKGKNACKKSASINLPANVFGTGFATSSGIKDIAKFAANATNGNPRFDLMSTADLTNKAINARKFSDQVFKKLTPKNDVNANPLYTDENNVGKLAKAILGESNIPSGMDAANASSSINLAGARSNTPAVNELLKDAQAKAGVDLSSSGDGLNKKNAKGKSQFALDLGDSNGQSASQVVQNFPEKAYKYKNSDIVTDGGASIFEVISNRYVQSGLRRLFEEDKKSK